MDSGGEQPTDELGGQYANFSGGQPGFNWGGLGQAAGSGLSNAGQSLSNSTQYPAGTSYGYSNQPLQVPGQEGGSAMIPSAGGSNEIVQLLQRLLGGGTGAY